MARFSSSCDSTTTSSTAASSARGRFRAVGRGPGLRRALARRALGNGSLFRSRAQPRLVVLRAPLFLLGLCLVELLSFSLERRRFGPPPLRGVRLLGSLLLLEPGAHRCLSLGGQARLLLGRSHRLAQPVCLGRRLLGALKRPHQLVVAPNTLALERLHERRCGLGRRAGHGRNRSPEPTTGAFRPLRRLLGNARDRRRCVLTRRRGGRGRPREPIVSRAGFAARLRSYPHARLPRVPARGLPRLGPHRSARH